MPSDGDRVRLARRVRRLLRVDPGSVDLGAIDPRSTPGFPSRPGKGRKAWSRAEVAQIGNLLSAYQERMYAAARAGTSRRRLLLVLQGTDCSGKDGTVRSVVGALNPLGVQIKAFGAPTPEELAHHFLWRIDRAMPPAGYVGVFNRSHYEDVLVARVRSLVPPEVWRPRYDQINSFEAAAVADGVAVIKVMLHISYEEQGRRLRARLEDPTKRWKFDPADVDDRDRWDEYQAAYADAIARCSTPAAPWYIVPADRKWYRNWATANLLLAHLADLAVDYPAVELDLAAELARLDGAPGKTSEKRPAGRPQRNAR
ncbi:MAG TPA: PPK2 family polyphosphate kinase [Micromonosporaceae bacterium]|nr:PPK2 family polyphosphate kinase [Micromonosporaceae bacterium]